MNMKHCDAVLLVWIKNLSGFSGSVVFLPITSGVEHQLCVSVPGVSAVAGEEEDAGKRNWYLLNEDSINFWAMWSYTEKLTILQNLRQGTWTSVCPVVTNQQAKIKGLYDALGLILVVVVKCQS